MPGLVQLRSETGPSLRDSHALLLPLHGLKPTPTIFASLRDFGMPGEQFQEVEPVGAVTEDVSALIAPGLGVEEVPRFFRCAAASPYAM
jgi:hypothetical protein